MFSQYIYHMQFVQELYLPETETKQKTSYDQEPYGGRRACSNLSSQVCLIDSSPWSDSVGHIIGAVSDGHHHS